MSMLIIFQGDSSTSQVQSVAEGKLWTRGEIVRDRVSVRSRAFFNERGFINQSI